MHSISWRKSGLWKFQSSDMLLFGVLLGINPLWGMYLLFAILMIQSPNFVVKARKPL